MHKKLLKICITFFIKMHKNIKMHIAKLIVFAFTITITIAIFIIIARCCEDQRLSWRLSYDSKDLSPSLFRMEAPLVCGEDFLSCSSTKENLNKL